MRSGLQLQVPRLYIFLIMMVVLFSVLNVVILFYGRNLFLYFQAIWTWAGILLLALIGAILIGMFMTYRLLAYREFTPFEREMMEMRLEMDECREMLSAIKERLDDRGVGPAPPPAPEEGGSDEDDD